MGEGKFLPPEGHKMYVIKCMMAVDVKALFDYLSFQVLNDFKFADFLSRIC